MPKGIYPGNLKGVKKSLQKNPRKRTPFNDFVKITDTCHIWTGGKTNKGYGMYNGKYAHRIAYENANGPIPELDTYHGWIVMHSCDNPSCVNPAHLSLGTAKDNLQDMLVKGRDRHLSGEQQGISKLTEQDVLEIRASYKPSTCRHNSTEFSQANLAKKYNVSQSNIYNIVNRKTWKHI